MSKAHPNADGSYCRPPPKWVEPEDLVAKWHIRWSLSLWGPRRPIPFEPLAIPFDALLKVRQEV